MYLYSRLSDQSSITIFYVYVKEAVTVGLYSITLRLAPGNNQLWETRLRCLAQRNKLDLRDI